jgi:hypothetical protein
MVEEPHNDEHSEGLDEEDFDEHFDEEDFDEEIDPELLNLASSGRRGSILRPILFGVVIWFGISIISDWSSQLQYFFSYSEPIEIGSVTEFAAERAKDPEWEPDIPHNRFVAIDGVPSRRAQSERYKFFKLVGDHVYIEVPQDDDGKTALEREFDKEDTDVDRTYFEGTGRALHLREVPHRYQGLRQYYYERYKTMFCGMPYSEAARAEAETTEQECVEGFLVQTDVRPSSHWWYLALTLLIGTFVLLNIWWLVRWIRDFIRS